MDFPILDLIGHEESTAWVERYFHPDGLKCPKCGAGREAGRVFRQTQQSRLTVYRCPCGAVYNLYTGTVLAQHHLRPAQVVLLLRGILQGETSAALSRELDLDYETVLSLRHELQAQAERLQAKTPLPDTETESDEVFQNAGEKRDASS